MRICRLACWAVWALAVARFAHSAGAGSALGPPEKVDAIRSESSGVFGFLVRGQPTALAAARQLEAKDPELGPSVDLHLIDGVALALRPQDAKALSERTDVTQVWYLDRALFAEYVHVLQGFEYAATRLEAPATINLSLGPPPSLMPIPGHDEEPMNAATRRVTDLGLIPVFAIGNYYIRESPNPGVVNPWCRPDWTICVGAANADATKLYDQSARGDPADPATWPTVVANGIDVISDRPRDLPKSPAQKQHDESLPQFLAQVPPGKRDLYSAQSGTSQAAAQVSRATAQITYFVRQAAIAVKDAGAGKPLFTLTIPKDRFDFTSRRGPRLTGDVGATTAEGVEITYRLVEPWRLVKQLLMDTAIPMPGFAPNEVGAGFVSPEYVEAQFGKYGIATKKLVPVKVI
jgi:hypothetical protein